MKLNTLAAAGAMAAALLWTGCLEEPHSVGAGDGAPATLNVRVGVDGVKNALAKPSVISLSRLILVFTSNANDTIRDTITPGTIPALNAASTGPQTVGKAYSLRPLRTWKLVASVKDARDSVIHRDSATTPVLLVGDTANLSLSLSARYSMYEAKFLNIPDSIGSATPGTVRQVLRLNRLVLRIDGVTVMDSMANPGPYFTPLATHALSYDYVTPGTHTVQMLAYGPMNSWNINNPLFSGSQVITVGAGADSTISLSLAWMGPTTGAANVSATIGKVGKVTINGTLPSNVVQ